MPGGLHPSLAVIATFPTPNYINPETHGNALFVITIITLVLIPIVVSARLWARLVVLRKPGWDDLLLCIAMLPNIGLGVCYLLSDHVYYFRRHIWDVPLNVFVPATIIGWCIELFYHLATSFTKLSVLLFYRRMTSGTNPSKFVDIVRVAIIFQAIWTLAFTLILCFTCRPLQSYWLRNAPTASYNNPVQCINEDIYWPVSAVISFVTDFVATILPGWFVFQLQLPKRQKNSLYAVFSLGFLVCLAGIARFCFVLYQLNYTYDEFWFGWYLWIVTAVETNGAILCASAPALKPLLDKYYLDMNNLSLRRSMRSISLRQDSSRIPEGAFDHSLSSPRKFTPDQSFSTRSLTTRSLTRPETMQTQSSKHIEFHEYEMR